MTPFSTPVMSRSSEHSNLSPYEYVEDSDKYLDYLGIEATKAINPEKFIKESYIKCCCCFCPRLFSANMVSSQSMVTTKKQILEIFKKSFMYKAIENSQAGIIIRDKNKNLIYCNRAYLKLVGYQRDELLRANPARPIQLNEHVLQDDEKYKTHIRCKDGNLKPGVITTSTLREADGTIIYQLLQFHEDLTSELIESEQTARSLLSTTSHEVRTALHGINGTLEYLTNNPAPSNAGEIREYHKAMLLSGQHILGILDNNLDFSKLLQGKHQFNYELFGLKHLIKTIKNAYSPILKSKTNNVKLTFEIGENIPKNLIGDQTCIRQIISNILSNSIKYTEKGFINIKISNITNTSEDYLLENDSEIFLYFKISDSGPGIAPETLQTLFTPYVQGKKAKKGTGIGLAISKLLVEAMGGEMLPVQSPLKEGKGSAFSFYIKLKRTRPISFLSPARFERSPDLSPLTPPVADLQILESNLRNKKVLIVDDLPLNRRILKRTLQNVNLSVTQAQSGEEALKILKAQPNGFDIIIMDVNMDGISGPETTKLIRAQINQTVPIIAFTADDSDEIKAECLKSGMNQVSKKNLPRMKLYLMINDLILPRTPPDEVVLTHTKFSPTKFSSQLHSSNEYLVRPHPQSPFDRQNLEIDESKCDRPSPNSWVL